ncbi:hypothetical protein SB861_03250 [Paraburkholderia sp. SIMBA_049]
MIALEKHPVKILHLNVRTEQHGDEERTAVDIKLGFDVPNTYLESLGPGLRESLYEINRQADPSLLDEADHLTHVRYPQLGKQKWAGGWEAVGLHLHLGNGRGKGDLQFGDTKLDKFLFEPKEGGTCACEARAVVLPTPDETAKLVGLLKRQVPATINMDDAVMAEPSKRGKKSSDEDENNE